MASSNALILKGWHLKSRLGCLKSRLSLLHTLAALNVAYRSKSIRDGTWWPEAFIKGLKGNGLLWDMEHSPPGEEGVLVGRIKEKVPQAMISRDQALAYLGQKIRWYGSSSYPCLHQY